MSKKVILSIVAITAILVSIVFGLYFNAFWGYGPAKTSNDWSAFGSLLSGVFSLVAAVGTIGTLYLLVSHHNEQASLLKKQLQLVDFECYEKHVNHFVKMLERIENIYGNQVVFFNKMALYEKYFPNKTPLKFDMSDNEYQNIKALHDMYQRQGLRTRIIIRI